MAQRKAQTTKASSKAKAAETLEKDVDQTIKDNPDTFGIGDDANPLPPEAGTPSQEDINIDPKQPATPPIMNFKKEYETTVEPTLQANSDLRFQALKTVEVYQLLCRQDMSLSAKTDLQREMAKLAALLN